MDKDNPTLKRYTDAIKEFFRSFKTYLKRRKATAQGAGTGRTAGDIRVQSVKIYSNALENIKLVLKGFGAFNLSYIRGYFKSVNDALAIERATDSFALAHTPQHIKRAVDSHKNLARQTNRLIAKADEIKTMEEVSPYVEELRKEDNKPMAVMPMFNSDYVKKREEAMQSYLEKMQQRKGQLPKAAVG